MKPISPELPQNRRVVISSLVVLGVALLYLSASGCAAPVAAPASQTAAAGNCVGRAGELMPRNVLTVLDSSRWKGVVQKYGLPVKDYEWQLAFAGSFDYASLGARYPVASNCTYQFNVPFVTEELKITAKFDSGSDLIVSKGNQVVAGLVYVPTLYEFENERQAREFFNDLLKGMNGAQSLRQVFPMVEAAFLKMDDNNAIISLTSPYDNAPPGLQMPRNPAAKTTLTAIAWKLDNWVYIGFLFNADKYSRKEIASKLLEETANLLAGGQKQFLQNRGKPKLLNYAGNRSVLLTDTLLDPLSFRQSRSFGQLGNTLLPFAIQATNTPTPTPKPHVLLNLRAITTTDAEDFWSPGEIYMFSETRVFECNNRRGEQRQQAWWQKKGDLLEAMYPARNYTMYSSINFELLQAETKKPLCADIELKVYEEDGSEMFVDSAKIIGKVAEEANKSGVATTEETLSAKVFAELLKLAKDEDDLLERYSESPLELAWGKTLGTWADGTLYKENAKENPDKVKKGVRFYFMVDPPTAAPGLSGKWRADVGNGYFLLNLQPVKVSEMDVQVGGTWEDHRASSPSTGVISSGKYSDKKLSLQITFESVKVPLTFEGSLAADGTISGTWEWKVPTGGTSGVVFRKQP